MAECAVNNNGNNQNDAEYCRRDDPMATRPKIPVNRTREAENVNDPSGPQKKLGYSAGRNKDNDMST